MVVMVGNLGPNASSQFMPANYRHLEASRLLHMDGFIQTYQGMGLDWERIHHRSMQNDASIPQFGFKPGRGDLQYWSSTGQGPMSVLAFTGERDRIRLAADRSIVPLSLLMLSSDASPSVRHAVEANPVWSEAKSFAREHEIPISPAPQGQKSGGNGGCYIATAVYGSYDAPEVLVLRHFRDTYMARTALGRAGIRFYYAVSPSLARHIGGIRTLRHMSKRILDWLVQRLESSHT